MHTNPDSIDEVVKPSNEESTKTRYIVAEENFKALQEEIASLRDLFARRLLEDKQKNELIKNLKDEAQFAFVEPFIYDLILLLDRVSQEEGAFAESVGDELYDILNRRGVEIIPTDQDFNPQIHRAIRVQTNDRLEKMRIVKVVRKGYTQFNKVIRPADVIVEKPQ